MGNIGIDLETKKVVNYSEAPDQYDEPEGIFPGYKATHPVVSDHGRFRAFQMPKIADPAGVGRGVFLYDFDKATKR
jgi:hypothetical protein